MFNRESAKTKANFDRLVSNKTFWNATTMPILPREIFRFVNFENNFLAEKFKFYDASRELLWRSASGKDLNVADTFTPALPLVDERNRALDAIFV